MDEPNSTDSGHRARTATVSPALQSSSVVAANPGGCDRPPGSLPTEPASLLPDQLMAQVASTSSPITCEIMRRAAEEIIRLERELKVQNAVNDLAYIPHRNLVEQNDSLRGRLEAAEKHVRILTTQRDALAPANAESPGRVDADWLRGCGFRLLEVAAFLRSHKDGTHLHTDAAIDVDRAAKAMLDVAQEPRSSGESAAADGGQLVERLTAVRNRLLDRGDYDKAGADVVDATTISEAIALLRSSGKLGEQPDIKVGDVVRDTTSGHTVSVYADTERKLHVRSRSGSTWTILAKEATGPCNCGWPNPEGEHWNHCRVMAKSGAA